MADFNTEDMITYDELSKSLRDLIDSKALALNLANHVADSTSHITKEERDKWNSSASGSDMTNHINNDSIHVSVEDRESWSN
jgi:hypothetical protein